MSGRSNSNKKIFLLIPAIALSCLAWSQADTSGVLSEEMKEVMIDTTETIVEPVPDDEDYDEGVAVEESKYFLKRAEQVNGGGPDSIQHRQLSDSLLKRLQGDEGFWYVNYPFEEKPTAGNPQKRNIPLSETPAFQTLLWLVIIGGFAAFVIIYLSNSNAGLFRRKSVAIAGTEEEEASTDNIFEINYQREIEKAVGKGNYRFAVRLMFLRLLRNMSEKNVIQYKPDKTNFDYLVQLHPTKHYGDFFRITRNYEYSWYGQFDIDPDKFALIKTDFDNFDNKLKY
ncbi:MAG: hypothetical protein JNK14_01080 [Chitinophagaceae bacterium]|nr:hypothetical protein [Chitinophagaceae bacterium]